MSPESKRPTVSVGAPDEDPYMAILQTQGMRGLALYRIVVTRAERRDSNSIFDLSVVTGLSVKKIAKLCRGLADGGWIQLDGEFPKESASNSPSRPENEEGVVYLLSAGDRYKIGVTTNLPQRIIQINSSQSPFPVVEEFHVVTASYRSLERNLHELYAARRAHGEWFTLSPDDVIGIKQFMIDWATSERAAR